MGMYFKREDLPTAPEVPGWLIMRCVSGSQAYGMATPESDVDIRGIFIPKREYHLGFMKRVEQIESKPETVIYALQKFMKLACDANPNILELLFVPEDCLLEHDECYDRLVKHRKLFLSTKARHTYTGYATAQIHRIARHRRWLLDPPKAAPVRSDYGLPEGEKLVSREQLGAFYVTLAHMLERVAGTLGPEMGVLHGTVMQIVQSEQFMGWEGLVQSCRVPDEALPQVQKLTGASDNFIRALQLEQAYFQVADEWKNYQTWKENRNPARAAMEAKYGLDGKHASHVVRLLDQGEHLMRTGELLVRLPNAEQIRRIREGVWLDGSPLTYAKLLAYAKSKESSMQALATSGDCPLPRNPDRKALDELCAQLIEETTP